MTSKNNRQLLWCTGFNEFRQLMNSKGWDTVPDNVAIISINNSKYAHVEDEYHIFESADNVLNLDFDDIDPMALGLDEYTEIHTYNTAYGDNTIQFFTDKMASDAVDFIERNIDKDFYIHCSAGVSRSQAFVRYISTTYFNHTWFANSENPCRHPNGFVYAKLNKHARMKFFNDIKNPYE